MGRQHADAPFLGHPTTGTGHKAHLIPHHFLKPFLAFSTRKIPQPDRLVKSDYSHSSPFLQLLASFLQASTPDFSHESLLDQSDAHG